jgi:hypothetical protein
VTRGRNAQQRPAHLRDEPLADATAWLAHYQSFYEGSLDSSVSTWSGRSARKERDHG